MFLPLPTDAVTLTHAAPTPAPADAALRPSAVPPALAILAEELVEHVPVRLTTTSTVVGEPTCAAASRPVLVARPRTSHEVAQVIRAARALGVPVAVPADERGPDRSDAERAGAATAGAERPDDALHDADPCQDLPAPPSVAAQTDADTRALEGAVLVSTQGLTGVTVLPVLARAHVGAGVRWRDLLVAAAHYGLVPVAALRAAADVERVPVPSGATRARPPAAAGPAIPDDARVTDVLTRPGVRAVNVVTGTGALRRIVPGERRARAGSATTGGRHGSRGVVVAVELDLVERTTP